MDQDKICRLGVHSSHLQVIAGGSAHQSPQVQGEGPGKVESRSPR